ncbi:DUF1090 domain-containing protein [Klebsiella pneumoniae]|nr:DUF1090 domain-containing protein [Klebsiella pneumoniae]
MEKEQDIQREISYAEKHHNQSRIDGLNTALRQVRETVATVNSKPIISKKLPNISEEIAERQRSAGSPEERRCGQINKRQHKLLMKRNRS